MQGVVHGNIKPKNVMEFSDGHFRLVNMESACVTGTSQEVLVHVCWPILLPCLTDQCICMQPLCIPSVSCSRRMYIMFWSDILPRRFCAPQSHTTTLEICPPEVAKSWLREAPIIVGSGPR